MANRRQRQRKAARIRFLRKQSSRKLRKRPTPLQAMELQHAKLAGRLAARTDRFSQLLSRVLKDEHQGQYLLSKSNLSAAERIELQALAPGAHAGFRAELLEATERLRNLLELGDPLYITAIVQLSNLFGGWGTYYEPTHEGSEPKVELVTGLLATQPVAKISDGPSDAEMQRTHDELDHILEVLLLFNFSMLEVNDRDTAALRITGAMRWMLLRGSSYGNHGRDLARALYGPHDKWMLATYGVTVDDVIGIGDAVESLVNRQFNELRDRANGFATDVLKKVQAEETRRRLPAEVNKQLGTDEGRFHVHGRALIHVLQAGIRQALTFSVDDLALNSPLPRGRIEAALKELSIAVGSLEPSAYTGLFDASPFVQRPFLEFNGRYLLAVPGMVLRDCVALLEDRFMTRKATFSKARAKTLDSLAVTYLSSMLPGSKSYTNLFYEGPELDGLVLFEDTAFVVEGKGTGLSVQSHRGDVKRLQRDIGKAVEEAWRQAARAREFLLRPGDSVFRDEQGAEIRIPARSVREVIIVNPTLHELGGHAPQLGHLRALGLYPHDELPWSVYINDLRVISETSDNAAIFLHYLRWRNRLPLGDRITVTDEIDLWASYLFCERFAILGENGRTMVANASTDFDAYYDGLIGHGPKRPPPTKFLCEPVKAFVDRMAVERPAGWRDAAGACLDLSIPELAYVCGKANDLVRHATLKGRLIWLNIGRVSVVAIPPGAEVTSMLDQPIPDDNEPTVVIYCREAASKGAEIVWAKYLKDVTLELSEFEKAAFNAVYAGEAGAG